MKRDRVLDRIVAIAIFLAVFVSHFASGNSFASDSKWTIHTALSIIRQGNTDLDEYRDLVSRLDEYGAIETFGGHIYTNFPIGPSLMAVPFVFIIDQLARHMWSIDLQAYVSQTIPTDIEKFVASMVVALTTLVMYHIARLFLNRSRALVIVFVFAFCTPAWSTASRALWQHGPSMLMLSLTVYLLLLARKTPRLSQFAGLPLALSYVMRQSNNLAVILLGLFVFTQYRRYFPRFLAWAAVVVMPFVAYNWSVYQSLLSPYYTLYQSASAGEFIRALVGTLFSPSRGLFIFSPILLLSVAGAIGAIRRRTPDSLDAFIVAILILHWIITSLWPIWWGGWSFGPRLFADTIPYWIYLMIPGLASLPGLRWARSLEAHTPFRISAKISNPWTALRRFGVIAVVLTLVALSFFVHYRGANAEDAVLEWSAYPANVDTHPDRLWDWRDIQFLRGIPWGTPANVSISAVPIRQMDVATYQVLGTNVLLARRFDASASLIAAPGTAWIILANEQPVAEELKPLFDGVALNATGRTPETGIAYQLYAFDLGERILETARGSEQAAAWSAELFPDSNQTRAVHLPASFGQAAALIGFQIDIEPNSSRLSVLTYWQARHPISTPVRLFVHAINREGQLIAQDDRLDARSQDWRPGDIIAQINRLDVPPASGPIWIEMGLYDPNSGERLPVRVDEQTVEGRLLLGLFQLK